jgi:hypothetical protein
MHFRFATFVAVPLTLTATVLAGQTQAKPVTVPFELANRHIVLQARVNASRPLAFILDTGADAAIVMTNVATELGLKLTGSVAVGGAGAGQQTGSLVQGANWSLDALGGFVQPVAMALLPCSSPPAWARHRRHRRNAVHQAVRARSRLPGADDHVPQPRHVRLSGQGRIDSIEFYRAHRRFPLRSHPSAASRSRGGLCSIWDGTALALRAIRE